MVASTCLLRFPTFPHTFSSAFSGLSCGPIGPPPRAPFPCPGMAFDDSRHFCNCHNVVFFSRLAHFILLLATRLLSLFFCFTIFTARAFGVYFSVFSVSLSFWRPLLPAARAAVLIVQTRHYCFLRPTTRKHNVNRGQAGLRPAYSGHIWVTGKETPFHSTPLLPVPCHSTFPYHIAIAPLPLLTIRRFSIVCKCAKLKAGKARKSEERRRKARTSRTWSAVL